MLVRRFKKRHTSWVGCEMLELQWMW